MRHSDRRLHCERERARAASPSRGQSVLPAGIGTRVSVRQSHAIPPRMGHRGCLRHIESLKANHLLVRTRQPQEIRRCPRPSVRSGTPKCRQNLRRFLPLWPRPGRAWSARLGKSTAPHGVASGRDTILEGVSIVSPYQCRGWIIIRDKRAHDSSRPKSSSHVQCGTVDPALAEDNGRSSRLP
jgi:hypothetical protein